MKHESNYAFRQRLDQVHRTDRRDPRAEPVDGEVVIEEGWRIAVPQDASPYLLHVAADLQDYLFMSMGVSTLLVRQDALSGNMPGAIVLDAAPSTGALSMDDPTPLAPLSVSRSYRLQITPERVTVHGFDERGVAQACYYLEDLMNLRQGPFLSQGTQTREPVFSPRMVHSGWGIDQFPDAHLNAIAHAGFDAILVFVKGVNRTTTGFADLNDIIARAARHGLDVYLYSYITSRKHPDDPAATAFYDSTYGDLMRAHPGARGVIFVGESCEFPSRDPHTTGKLRSERTPADTRPNPGWWPCSDYPDWLNLVKRIIRAQQPDADIVFWTYNWGWAPEDKRLELIAALPRDVSLQATFEMFENVERRGTPTRCVDYTVSFAGPGTYFASEARAAHERGLRLYTMSNTGGQTWDFGVVPYEPVPWQWARRHAALLQASQDWGLCGLMESHHMGWWPSVVTDLAKWAFWRPVTTAAEMIPRLAQRDFGPGAAAAMEAWEHWSEAIVDYVPTNEDQYGPFRVGPSYPLLLDAADIEFPAAEYAHFGRRILKTEYRPHDPDTVAGEIVCLQAMEARWSAGIDAMRRAVEAAPRHKGDEARRMLLLGEFIRCCVRTAIHVKQWWQLRQELDRCTGTAAAADVLDRLTAVGRSEIDNARDAIPLVDMDSRLGWEPSMEYMADRAHLEWKIAQVEQVLSRDIPARRLAGAAGTGKR